MEPANTSPKRTHTSPKPLYKHALYKMWHLAYLDKKAFGQATVQLSQQDVLQICQQQGRAPEQGACYVVPVQPGRPLSLSNAVLVSKLQRRFLLAMWKLTKDEEAYRGCVDTVVVRQ